MNDSEHNEFKRLLDDLADMRALDAIAENENLKAELERVQKDRDELRQVAQLANKVRGDAMSELERVQKQAAAMREAIKYCIADWKERHVGLLKKALEPTQDFPTPDELRAKAETYNFAAADLEHALKSDAGANYVSKEELERAQKECDETCARVRKLASEDSTAEQRKRVTAEIELERVQKENAAFREVIGNSSDYVSKEQVKPLVEGLTEFLAFLESEGFDTAPAGVALSHARTIGLLE